MQRFIDANKIKLNTKTKLDEDDDTLVYLSDVIQAIAQTPTEEVAAIKHGRWLGSCDYECSVCHDSFEYRTPICPYCGARMDEEVDDE